jgi:hypothetical protein
MQAKRLMGLIWAINAQAMVEILKPFMEQCVLTKKRLLVFI